MLGGWRLVLRRTAHQVLVAAAVFATSLLALTVCVTGALYASSVTGSATRQAVRRAPTGEQALQFTATTSSRVAAADTAVRHRIDAAYAPMRPTTSFSLRSDGWQVLTARARAGRHRLLVDFAAYQHLAQHARLVTGRWPAAGGHPTHGAATAPLSVAAPVAAARGLHLRIGERLRVRDGFSRRVLDVRLVGTYSVRAPDEVYWFGDRLETTGARRLDFTTFGPLVASRPQFQRRVAPTDADARWRVGVSPASVRNADLGSAAARLDRLVAGVAAAPSDPALGLTSIAVTSELPELLRRVQRAELAARSTMLVPLVMIALLACCALLLTTRLLADHRRAELALARARGASRGQLLGWAGREVLVLVIPAVAVSVALATIVLRATAHSTGFRTAGITIATPGSGSGDPSFGLGPMLLGIVLTVVAVAAALVAPLLRRERTYLQDQTEGGRAARVGGVARAGLDVALLALAAVSLLQLRRYAGPVTRDRGGGLGIDPLLVAGPAILLLAAATVTLRLLPVLARLAERLTHRGRTLPAALAGWEVGRRPGRYAAPTLLLVLALSVGMFSGSYAASLSQSQRDQATFATGGDLQVVPDPVRAATAPFGLAAAFRSTPDVTAALPVHRTGASLQDLSLGALLVGSDAAPSVLRTRADLAEPAYPELFRRLRSAAPSPRTVALPDGVQRIELTMAARALPGSSLPSDLAVRAAVTDSAGQLAVIDAAPLALDGRPRRLTFDLRSPPRAAGQGLRLLAVDVVSDAPEAFSDPARFSVELQSIVAVSGSGARRSLRGLRWRPAAAPTPAGVPASKVRVRADRPDRLAAADVTPGGAGGLGGARVVLAVDDLASALPSAVPVVLDDSTRRLAGSPALDGTQTLAMGIEGVDRPLRPVGLLHAVPTSDGPTVMADLATWAFVRYLFDGSSTLATEWWLRTDGARAAPALAIRPALGGSLRDRAALASALRHDPLSVGSLGALAMAVVAATVLGAIGLAAHASVSASERGAELGVLRTLGLSASQLTTVLVAEQSALVAVGGAVGVGLGLLTAHVVVPLVLLTPDAAAPVPPALVSVPWAATATIGLVLAGVLLSSTALLARRLTHTNASSGGGQ